MNELVSIIIPVYNCAKMVEGCVNSIMRQTYQNFEILLINDGSSDESGTVCLSLASHNNSIHYYSQSNSGASVARNNGLSHATGQYIMFVDADDELNCNSIERLMQSVDDDTDMVCCSYEILENKKKEYMYLNEICAKTNKEKEMFYLQLMDYRYGHPVSNVTAIGVPWGKIFRKKMIINNNMWFDPSLRRMQDNIFVMDAIYYSRTVKYIPECLYVYRVGHINSYKTYSPEVYIGVLERRDTFFSNHPQVLTKKIRDFAFYEHLNYLMMSIYYSVANTDKKTSIIINQIKLICGNPVFTNTLNNKPSKQLTIKQRIQLLLYRKHLYYLLYLIYRNK